MWKQLFPDNSETLCQVLWGCAGKHVKIPHPRTFDKVTLKKQERSTFLCIVLGAKMQEASGRCVPQRSPCYTSTQVLGQGKSHSPRSIVKLWVRENVKSSWVCPCHDWVSTFWWFLVDDVLSKHRPGHRMMWRDLRHGTAKWQVLHPVLWGRPVYVSRPVCNHGINIYRTDDMILAVWSNSLPSFQ